jgi:hypothetical protein
MSDDDDSPTMSIVEAGWKYFRLAQRVLCGGREGRHPVHQSWPANACCFAGA